METPRKNGDTFLVAEHWIAERLQSLMHQELLFRQPGLKIEDLARQIGTNRMYLSRHINQTYGMNFNVYLNHLRVEYAKQYFLENPHSLQEQVATESGFVSAQAFSRKFREYVGVTPRTWLSQQELPED